MAHTCTKCHRVNPSDAIYCYFDGMILDGHGRNGGPIPIGAKLFPNQFVFPSGRSCRNFDELALACQNEWQGARQLLEQGYLERFLSGIGRADLALAAKEAARFPDHDRGLDQLLEKLPSNVLTAPQLQVEPREVNLGQMQVGQDRKFELHLDNAGKRLLYGTVSLEDCPWLSLGDGQGASQKIFQFGDDLKIPVHVQGKRFRAGNKPLEGRVLIESNGGTKTVTVRVEVPVKPFPEGVLAGSKSPRQVAEKAKERPKESASLFEKGAVAKWYKDNGWSYPVQAPSSSGLGAVQQFFEALGLTPPPKVDISERSVALRGEPGDTLRHKLEVKAQEKRPVWAHAVSDQAWLEVGRAKLNGRTASIPLVVPAVPRRSGETLTARVTVTANGNQRFVVPVTLTIGGAFAFGPPEPIAVTPEPAFVPPPREAVPANDLEMAPIIRRTPTAGPNPVHLLPLVLLLVILGGIMIWDLLSTKKDPDGGDPTKFVGGDPNFQWTDLKDREPRIGINFQQERLRFGITELSRDPNPKLRATMKKLTYEERGDTNNTCIKIAGPEGAYENLFFQKPGKMVRGLTPFDKFPDLKNRHGWVAAYEHFPGKIHVTQTVELVPGEATRVFDTALVRYKVKNEGTAPRTVGLRILLDTFIGEHDGVPFTIPGIPGLMNTMIELDSKDIPDYVEAIEHEDLANPGTKVRIGLKGITLPNGEEPEPMAKLVICRWPEEFAGDVRWDWPYESIQKPNTRREKDSCIVLYWPYLNMPPGQEREMAFTYGLSSIATGSGGDFKLGLSAGGSFKKGGEFTLTAYVMNPQAGQTVELASLPPHLKLAKGEAYQKTVDKGDGKRAQVSWKINSSDVGAFKLTVTSGKHNQSYEGQIREGGIFGK